MSKVFVKFFIFFYFNNVSTLSVKICFIFYLFFNVLFAIELKRSIKEVERLILSQDDESQIV